MRAEPSKGFTFLELIVSLAVAAILLAVAVPSFLQTIKNGRISAEATCLNLALLSARSEAVRRSSFVTVCPRGGADSCGSDWSKGALVFTEGADENLNRTPDLDTATVDVDSTILRRCPPVHEDNSVVAIASADRDSGNSAKRQFIRYTRDGQSNWEPGFIAVCDDRESHHWKAMNVGVSGDIRSARTHSDSDALVDAFNRKITSCD